MKSLKSKWFAMAGVITAMAVTSLQAIPITGSIDMSGTASLDNTSLGSATKATSFLGVTVGGIPTGSFIGTAGDAVTWSTFGWSPATTPVPSLWSYFDIGTGRTYAFDLTTVSVVSQDNTFLNLLGTGTLNISGVGPSYDPTGGNWSFTISNPSGGSHANFAFTFANSQTASTAVPDSGLTVALLGFALIGVEGLRRKLIK